MCALFESIDVVGTLEGMLVVAEPFFRGTIGGDDGGRKRD